MEALVSCWDGNEVRDGFPDDLGVALFGLGFGCHVWVAFGKHVGTSTGLDASFLGCSCDWDCFLGTHLKTWEGLDLCDCDEGLALGLGIHLKICLGRALLANGSRAL